MLMQAPLACADCRSLHDRVQGADYFELFGLPRRFAVDAEALQSRYLAISRNIHPDGFATAEPEMQSLVLRLSAAVNKAYDTLRDPIQRANYLLETSGGKSAADDKRVPPDLLAHVMMLREQIEEAKAEGRAAELASIKQSVQQRRSGALEEITATAGRLDAGAEGTRDALRLQLNAMKYWDNLMAQL